MTFAEAPSSFSREAGFFDAACFEERSRVASCLDDLRFGFVAVAVADCVCFCFASVREDFFFLPTVISRMILRQQFRLTWEGEAPAEPRRQIILLHEAVRRSRLGRSLALG